MIYKSYSLAVKRDDLVTTAGSEGVGGHGDARSMFLTLHRPVLMLFLHYDNLSHLHSAGLQFFCLHFVGIFQSFISQHLEKSHNSAVFQGDRHSSQS